MTLELTSQTEGNLIDGLRNHPNLASWLSSGYPISISTDDPGIFHTDSTQELLLLKEAFDVNPVDLVHLVLLSIEHIFETECFRQKLTKSINEQIEKIIRSMYSPSEQK
jgi:adenosine deaminase